MNYSNQEVLKFFPYPEFRKGQDRVIIKVNDAFNSGIRCILLSLPTGWGKSGIITVFCRANTSIYSTPQNQLIDQIKNDKYLSKYYTEIKVRQNYCCIKDYSGTSTVDVGMCTSYKGYIPTYCNKNTECPYWRQKLAAVNSIAILTNPVYLMLEGKIEDPTPPRIGRRELLVVDESHFIEDRIIDVSSFEVKPWQLGIRIPDIKNKAQLRDFVYIVRDKAQSEAADFDAQLDINGNISMSDVKQMNILKDAIAKSDLFISHFNDEWIWEIKFSNIQGKVIPYLKVTPLHASLFGSMLWSKSTNKVIVSSATLLNPMRFIADTGLDKIFKRNEILVLEAPSIFPKENRPIIDLCVGNLTMNHLEKNLIAACQKLEYIMSMESGNIAIHIPSYNLVDKIITTMRHKQTKYYHTFITHESSDRIEKMEKWTNSRGFVFFAVAFTEGYDWKGDIVDAQVLFKVPYADVGDKRIAKLLELKRWDMYYTKTITNVIQAYGRSIRSETDKKRFYVLDSSFWTLISRTKRYIPQWFLEALPNIKKF